MDWSTWDTQSASWGTCSSSYTTRSNCKNNNRIWTPDRTKSNGCVTDRDQNYDTMNTEPSSANAPTMVVAEEYASGSTNYCKIGSSSYVQPIVPLSSDWSALKTAIGNLEPTGNTNQGIGLAWGWLTLGVGVAPFNAPAKDTANYTYKDAIVLLSDGLNTQNRWYGSTEVASIDARQKILCANAKGAPNNGTIYTVQVDTGGDGASDVLQQCASGSDKYFHITDPNLSVFNSIGQSLAKLRIAR